MSGATPGPWTEYGAGTLTIYLRNGQSFTTRVTDARWRTLTDSQGATSTDWEASAHPRGPAPIMLNRAEVVAVVWTSDLRDASFPGPGGGDTT
jgi:hypothetical protein